MNKNWPQISRGKLVIWLVGVLFVWGLVFTAPPRSFPVGVPIAVAEGSDVTSVGQELKRGRVLRSPALFRVAVGFLSPQRGVLAGDYVFEKPLGLWAVTARLGSGFLSKELIRVTLPEGLANEEMAEILTATLWDFNRDKFISLATPFIGQLFPDTYFFPPTASEEQVLAALQVNFTAQTEPLTEAIKQSGYSLNEILTMASLVEKEASGPEDRRLVAGVLWKRLEADMLLQVDAVFPYLVGRNTFAVTLDDLALDSPYNTYKYRGLPPGPIVNPSLAAIEATLQPTASDYWFYLSDREGHFYFAEDFASHKVNRERYLSS